MQIPASGAYQPFVAPLWLSWYRPVPLFEPSPVRTPSFLYVVRGVAQLGLADYCPAPRRIDDIAGGRSAAGGCRVGVGFTWAVAVVGGRVVCGGSHGWRVAWVVAVVAVVGPGGWWRWWRVAWVAGRMGGGRDGRGGRPGGWWRVTWVAGRMGGGRGGRGGAGWLVALVAGRMGGGSHGWWP